MLLAVLTCNPDDSELDALIERVEGLMQTGSFLFVSDLYIQQDKRNQARYRECSSETWGVFDLEEGATMRHFTRDRIQRLLTNFDEVQHADHSLLTMNGNPVQAFRSLLRYRGPTQKA